MNQMQGKVCLVTGANSGIGKVTARELARMGAHVVMICRSQSRGEAAQAEIIKASGNNNVELLLADLSVQEDIRQVAEAFMERHNQLDVLVNNAGAFLRQRRESADGIEMTFALNHLGYFMLTMLLLDTLKKSTPSRIVNVSSEAHRRANLDFNDLQNKEKYSGFGAYGQSKLANILFTYELARRLQGTGVTTNCLHPGFVDTNFGSGNGRILDFVFRIITPLVAKNEDEGAETSIYLASSPEVEGISGRYYDNKMEKRSNEQSYDERVAARLWQVSEELTSMTVRA